MNIRDIRELIELIEESAIEEFEMERSGVRIRVRKTTGPAGAILQQKIDAKSIAQQDSAPEELKLTQLGNKESTYTFNSPIIGTFYASLKPDAEPLVKVGDQVGKGTVLCVIEAMKIFNQIESDVDGEITRLLTENGQAVEYGQPLFEIQLIN